MLTTRGYQFKKLKGLAVRTIEHPRWSVENVRLVIARRAQTRQQYSLETYREYLVDQRHALASSLGLSEEECDAAIASASFDPTRAGEIEGTFKKWDASNELMITVGAIVRLTKPSIVVETGVARGFTSAMILAVMQQNGHGHLHSIDFPVLAANQDDYVGSAVPQHLRTRWTLHIGPSRHLLRPLLESVGPIDIFLHDADHTYSSQMEEYQTAWPFIRSGGLLLSDDVSNPAFVEFTTGMELRPHLVIQRHKAHPIGVIRKP